MLPVYFPFTSVSRHLMAASNGFFKKMAVYQIAATFIPERMKAWQNEKRLDIRLPLQHREKEITAILREFRTWAEHHQGGDLSFFKTSQGDLPFFDDSSVAQIRKEIKAGGEARTTIGKTESPDLHPGVFLQMAQDLDEKNREIAGDLKSQEAQGHELIKALKGDDAVAIPDGLGSGITTGDQAAYMISERTAAWARIMLGDDLMPLLLVTSNAMVLDDLVERAIPGGQEIQPVLNLKTPKGDAGQVYQCQAALAAYIENLQVSAWHDEKERPSLNWDCKTAAKGASLSLYVIPGVAPRTLLESYLAPGGGGVPGGEAAAEINVNSVVGVLKPEK